MSKDSFGGGGEGGFYTKKGHKKGEYESMIILIDTSGRRGGDDSDR